MADKDAFQRYLDAGVAFTNMTRARAEQLVQDLVSSGEFPSGDARAKVDELIERSRKVREALRLPGAARGRSPAPGAWASPASRTWRVRWPRCCSEPRTSGARLTARTKAAAKKRPAKKTAAKKAAAKKGAAKKASAKKAAAKKAAAKKAVAEEGIRQEEPGQEGGRPPRRRAPLRSARAARDRPADPPGAPAPRSGAGRARTRDEPRRRRWSWSRPGGSLVSGAVADKPAAPGRRRPSRSSCSSRRPRFVSRGGEKLAAALERFALDLRGAAGPRRGRLDRRVHRLPAPGRARCRWSRSTWATASSTSACARRPGRPPRAASTSAR